MSWVQRVESAVGSGALLLALPILVLVVAMAILAFTSIFVPLRRKEFVIEVLQKLVEAIRALRSGRRR